MNGLRAAYGSSSPQATSARVRGFYPWSLLEPGAEAPDPLDEAHSGLPAELFSKAIIAFARQHKEEVFCGFCLDCNVQEGGQILLCLNTVEHLKSKEGSTPQDERYRWSPGDWAHGELAATTRSAGWHSAIRPLLIDGYIELETAERMLECACGAALRIVDDGVLDALVRGEQFVVLVIDHDEGVDQARARMARVIAGQHNRYRQLLNPAVVRFQSSGRIRSARRRSSGRAGSVDSTAG